MNYIRTLSKSSLKSATTSEEATKLYREIETLRQTIEALKLTLESRDAAIGTLAREKEKLYIELKAVQRTNRNIHQQLEDERDMHSKEKEFLIEEINRLPKRNERYNCESKYSDTTECNLLNEEIRRKDVIIYNVCTKYMKLKNSKMSLLEELTKLQQQSQKACEDVINLLQENKSYLDELLDKIVEYSNSPPSSKHFFKMLQTNARLHSENTQLKVRLSAPASPLVVQRIGFEGNKYPDKFKQISVYEKYVAQDLKNSISQPQKKVGNKYVKGLTNANHNIRIPYDRCKIYKSFSDSLLVK